MKKRKLKIQIKTLQNMKKKSEIEICSKKKTPKRTVQFKVFRTSSKSFKMIFMSLTLFPIYTFNVQSHTCASLIHFCCYCCCLNVVYFTLINENHSIIRELYILFIQLPKSKSNFLYLIQKIDEIPNAQQHNYNRSNKNWRKKKFLS